jgi:hypothetical protein
MPVVRNLIGATIGIGSFTLRSFAKLSVITGIDYTETVSNPMTGDMNICLGLDDKTFSRQPCGRPKDDGIDST